MRRVVGVAGAPGAGKSTLVSELARAFAGAAVLRMDDYENMTRLPIDAVARWYRAGADIDAFDFPRLQADLLRLKGEGADDAVLLFETQFGRAHRATGSHIDLLVWLDTPLDVALARSVRAIVERILRGPEPQLAERLRWLHGYLDNYLGTVRELLEMQRARVAAGADLVIDGRASTADMAAAVQAEFGRRWP
jgi:uridine kinase